MELVVNILAFSSFLTAAVAWFLLNKMSKFFDRILAYWESSSCELLPNSKHKSISQSITASWVRGSLESRRLYRDFSTEPMVTPVSCEKKVDNWTCQLKSTNISKVLFNGIFYQIFAQPRVYYSFNCDWLIWHHPFEFSAISNRIINDEIK